MGSFVGMPSTAPDAPANEERGAPARTVSLQAQLIIVVTLLIVIGVVMIYSASSVMAIKKHGDAFYYVKRQLLCVGLGTGAMLFGSFYPYSRYKELAPALLILVYISLILVLIPAIGKEINGARRWFRLGPFSLQPAEYAKLVWIMYLSGFLVRKQERLKKFSAGLLPPIVLCGVFGVLLLLEPDFGTSFVIGLLTACMLAVGGVPWHHLFSLAPLGLLVCYRFVYHVEYRWERVTAFLNPWNDPRDSGYQLIQSWIAIGAGGLFGKGLGAGQQKLFYLPEPYTDFIMAVVGEETGFAGICIVSALFCMVAWIGISIAQQAKDHYGGLLAFGLTMMIALQAIINLAVVLGLFPTKGLPLPFISYGGSAFIANCLAVGILINIARKCVK